MADRERKRLFRLSPRMRGELRTDIDLEALEQLVGLLPPESRDLVLRAFLARPSPDAAPGKFHRAEWAGRSAASIGYDISFRDPKLQRLLKRVTDPIGRPNVVVLERTRQFNSTDRRFLEEPFGLALVGDLGEQDAGALVVRRTLTEPHDVILLSEAHLDARWFDGAIKRLLIERRENGLQPERDYKVTIPDKQPAQRLPAAWEGYVLQMLERVRASIPRQLGELGMVRFTEVRLM